MNYIPLTSKTKAALLEHLKISSVDELFVDIPESMTQREPFDLAPLSEMELKKELKSIAGKNMGAGSHACFLGAGAYNHFIPSAVKHIAGRSEFYTAYTPYQPEISQGILQAMYEYQTMICRLYGMDAANASLYDGASAIAEAAFLACNFTKRSEIIISRAVHPSYRDVLKTYAAGAKLEIIEADFSDGTTDTEKLKSLVSAKTACVIIQQPNFFGCLENVFEIEKTAHSNGALFVTSVDPISLGILKSPGEYVADIATGEGQPLGNALNFGGPYLGIFAVRKEFLRYMPGRIVGLTQDHNQRRGFVLTLQTREQHIRRERATSNICSNQALCALNAVVYMASMGRLGLKKAAEMSFARSAYAKSSIAKIKGYSIPFSAKTFKEFVVKLPHSADSINEKLLEENIIGGLNLEKFYPELKNHMLICTTEMNTKADIDKLARILKLSV